MDRPTRSALLLLGYGIGVAVMVSLLSVGDALLSQARDRDLAAGGDVVLLPQGIDPAVLKVRGITGLYFTIPEAGFVVRSLLEGPRLGCDIVAASPQLSHRLVYVRVRGQVVPAEASGGIPSLDQASRSTDRVPEAVDSPRDRAWLDPPLRTFADRVDHFHRPKGPPGAWAEWDYFTFQDLATGTYGYLTLMAGAQQRGLVLFRLRRGGHPVEDMSLPAVLRPGDLSSGGAAQRVGPGRVWVEGDAYRVVVAAPGLDVQLRLVPVPGFWLPPVETEGDGGVVSGYVVPVARGWVSGTVRIRSRTLRLDRAIGYHDHNWGTWRGVTWDWGEASSSQGAVLYGALHTAHGTVGYGRPPVLLLWASGGRDRRNGVVGVFPVQAITYDQWEMGPALGGRRVRRPGVVTVRGASGGDQVVLTLRVIDALGSSLRDGQAFLQLRTEARVRGTVDGHPVSWDGPGAAETFVPISTR